MNRIDRLFAILLALQRQKRIRGQDLAAEFAVSTRTIYRDMLALHESGVPILSLPGEGYELLEGYYLPPLNFSDSEAVALILGTQLLRQQAAGSVTSGAQRALDKITAALPKGVRARVESLTSIISFFSQSDRFNLDDPHLLTLQQAIQEQRVVQLRYHGIDRDATTERVIEPARLFYAGGIWYVEGYCRLRRDQRVFRLSRVEQLALGAATFGKRTHERKEPTEGIVVRVRFAAKILRWVRERQHYGFQEEESGASQEGASMTYQVRKIAEIMPWLLSWGSGAEVLSPPELREMICGEVQKLSKMLT
jgi:predicted DNA-binding transcriptional regulator YafY